MTASEDTTPHTVTLAERIADVTLTHPSVIRLDAGQFDVISTPLPGKRVLGVRIPGAGTPIEVAVALRLDRPLPGIVAELRGRIRTVTGPSEVDITVSDVVVEQPGNTPGTNPLAQHHSADEQERRRRNS